jgi:uncharacterized spore protein YtfJ
MKYGRNMTAKQEGRATSADSFIERLAHQIGAAANAKQIYGEPVERDGVTVITVSKAVYGFGGGGGIHEGEEGSGGGGGVVLTPAGYIEIKNGETRFRPTRDWLAVLPAVAATAPLILLSLWALTKMIRKLVPDGNPGRRPRASTNLRLNAYGGVNRKFSNGSVSAPSASDSGLRAVREQEAQYSMPV